MKPEPYFVTAIEEMDFGQLRMVARSDMPHFPRAGGRIPVLFFANDGTGLRALIARLLRAGCLPFVMCLHVPSGRAFAIECIAESATAYSFEERELPLADADWLRKLAELARRLSTLRRRWKS